MASENKIIYAFHPKYFGKLGLWKGMDLVDKDTVRITYVPYTEDKKKPRKTLEGIVVESIIKTQEAVSIEVPSKCYEVINGVPIIFMHPLTQEIWLTPRDFSRIRDLSSYSKIKNQLKAYADAVFFYKEAVHEKDDTIESLESRISTTEGHTALLQAETKMFEVAVASIRNQMADAETRLTHFKAKMESAVILHKDASEVLKQFPELFKFSHSMVLATKSIVDEMQDTLIHKRSRSIEDIQEKQKGYEKKLNQIKEDYTQTADDIFTEMDKRIGKSKEPNGSERAATGDKGGTPSPTFARESKTPTEESGGEGPTGEESKPTGEESKPT